VRSAPGFDRQSLGIVRAILFLEGPVGDVKIGLFGSQGDLHIDQNALIESDHQAKERDVAPGQAGHVGDQVIVAIGADAEKDAPGSGINGPEHPRRKIGQERAELEVSNAFDVIHRLVSRRWKQAWQWEWRSGSKLRQRAAEWLPERGRRPGVPGRQVP
jgi:hypothetical protein